MRELLRPFEEATCEYAALENDVRAGLSVKLAFDPASRQVLNRSDHRLHELHLRRAARRRRDEHAGILCWHVIDQSMGAAWGQAAHSKEGVPPSRSPPPMRMRCGRTSLRSSRQ